MWQCPGDILIQFFSPTRKHRNVGTEKRDLPRALLTSLAVLSLSISSATLAGGIEAQGELRFVSPTDATSNCIGNPITPLCAVETFIACTLRIEPSLCRRIGIDDYNYPKQKGTSRYYVVSTRTIPEGENTGNLPNTDQTKPSLVEITILEPDFRLDWCPEGCKTSYFLKQVGDLWLVDGHAVWGAP